MRIDKLYLSDKHCSAALLMRVYLQAYLRQHFAQMLALTSILA